MAKKKRRKRIIILIIVLAVVALLVAGYFVMRGSLAQDEKMTYQTVKVQKGTIEVKVKGSGSVQPLSDEPVYAVSAGTVDTVQAEDGDIVKADDVIATFKSDDLESSRDSLNTQIDDADAAIAALRGTKGSDHLRSPIKGTVEVLYASAGDNVDAVMDKYGALAIVSSDELMQVVVPFNAGVDQGQKAVVTAGEKNATGVVVKLDSAKNEITVSFTGGLAAGDMATVSGEGGTSLGEGVVTVANPVYITGRGGVIDKVYKGIGKKVSRGGNMFRLDGDILSSQLYAKIDQRSQLESDLKDVEKKLFALIVKAGTDGVVSDLQLNKDQVVQAGAKLFSIESNEKVKIDVDIDELDIADITPEQKATVTFDALPDKQFTARVDKIDPIGVSQNNVTHFTAALELDNATGVMLGMSADVEIISKIAENVLYVPIEAIQIVGAEKFVVLAQDIKKDLESTPATHKVTTGITDGVNIEITGGLLEGDQVAVPQAKALSLQEQQMQMFGNRLNGGANTGGNSSQSPAASE